MPDLKISQFVDGNAVQETDEIATNRGGVNTKVKVGSAASKNVGTGTGEIPLFDDLGSAAFANVGYGPGEVLTVDELPNVLGDMAFKDSVTVADMDAESSTAGQVPVSDGSGSVTWQDQSGSGSTPAASVSFVNTGTNLAATNAQTAIEEVNNKPVAQCYLTKSGANLLLTPENGNQITIDGKSRTIPSGGVTIAPTGATTATIYYLYVYWSGTAILGEYSATAPVKSTSNGMMVKTGDATRTYVGLWYTSGAATWGTNGAQASYGISYYNRKKRILSSSAGGKQTTVAAFGKLDVTTDILIVGNPAETNRPTSLSMISYAQLSVTGNVVGAIFNNTANLGSVASYNNFAGGTLNMSRVHENNLTNNLNTISMQGYGSSGTCTWQQALLEITIEE